MFSFQRPSTDSLRRYLQQQESADFTYAPVGATNTRPPAGYVLDHSRIKLGTGEPVFQMAKAALQRWDQFLLGWIEVWPQQVPIQSGEVVVTVCRSMNLWWLNSCRIVYVVDVSGPICKFGFAYGTLHGHVESGEERFLVELDQTTGDVHYDIVAFSRPNHFLTKLGYPMVRRLQNRFRRESATAMLEAVMSNSIECSSGDPR